MSCWVRLYLKVNLPLAFQSHEPTDPLYYLSWVFYNLHMLKNSLSSVNSFKTIPMTNTGLFIGFSLPQLLLR